MSSRILGQVFGVPKGDFQTTDSQGTQPIGGGSHHLKVMTSCHTRNFLISLRYCINGLYLAAFWGFKISSKIAVLFNFASSEMEMGRAIFNSALDP